MNGIALLLAVGALGVDYSWHRTEDGQLEYNIQIEPALLDAFREGQAIISEVRPGDAEVQRFRIAVGNGTATQVAVAPERQQLIHQYVDHGWRGLNDGHLEYIIQLRPELITVLQQGEPIIGQLHPEATGVRRFHILMGTGELPRVGGSQPPNVAGATQPVLVPQDSTTIGGGQATIGGQTGTGRQAGAGGQTSLDPEQARDWRDARFVTGDTNPPRDASWPRFQNPQAAAADTSPTTPAPPFDVTRNTTTRNNTNPTYPYFPQTTQAPRTLAPPAGTASQDSVNLRPQAGQFQNPADNFTTGSRGTGDFRFRDYTPQPRADTSRSPMTVADNRPVNDPQRYSEPSRNVWPTRPAGQQPSEPPRNDQRANYASSQSASSPDAVPATQRQDYSPTRQYSREPDRASDTKPWMPLLLTTLALFASMGGNAYLAWVSWGFFWRYRDLTDEMRRVRSTAGSGSLAA